MGKPICTILWVLGMYIGIRGNVEHPRGKGGRIVSPDVTDLVEKHTAAA